VHALALLEMTNVSCGIVETMYDEVWRPRTK
jgi:hypothetical protein